MVKKDGSERFTEKNASKGRLGRIMGPTVLTTAINMRNDNRSTAC